MRYIAALVIGTWVSFVGARLYFDVFEKDPIVAILTGSCVFAVVFLVVGVKDTPND